MNVEYTKIDRMFVLEDPIKQRTTLVLTRCETNVEYAKIDRMLGLHEHLVYLGMLYISS
jgi:hypothetical protein